MKVLLIVAFSIKFKPLWFITEDDYIFRCLFFHYFTGVSKPTRAWIIFRAELLCKNLGNIIQTFLRKLLIHIIIYYLTKKTTAPEKRTFCAKRKKILLKSL